MHTPTRASKLPEPIALAAGQRTWMQLRHGDAVCVVHGEVMLTEPAWWLAERWVAHTTRVPAGEGHAITRAGWVQLVASGPTLLQPMPVERHRGGVLRYARGAWRRLAGSTLRPRRA